jgi:hypothetical protein
MFSFFIVPVGWFSGFRQFNGALPEIPLEKFTAPGTERLLASSLPIGCAHLKAICTPTRFIQHARMIRSQKESGDSLAPAE